MQPFVSIRPSFVQAALLFLFFLFPAAAQEAGNLRVHSTTGTSAQAIVSGLPIDLAEGVFLQQGTSILTGPDSSTTLLFDNGAILQVGPDSDLLIDSYSRAPLDPAKTDYKRLFQEPSTSQTRIRLASGTLFVEIRNPKKTSLFEISLPEATFALEGGKHCVRIGNTPPSPPEIGVALGQARVFADPEKPIPVPAGKVFLLQSTAGAPTLRLADPTSNSLLTQARSFSTPLRNSTPPSPFENAPTANSEVEGKPSPTSLSNGPQSPPPPKPANLAGANFRKLDFADSNLAGADLSNSDLRNANLSNANLDGANLQGAIFDSTTRWPTGFDPAGKGLWGPNQNYSGENLQGSNLTNFDLTGSNFSKADLTKVPLRGANLTGATLEGAILKEADLADTNFTGANLHNALLTEARFNARTLFPEGFDPASHSLLGPNTDWSRKKLNGRVIHWTDFSNANFSQVDLKNSTLMGCNFTGANLEGAKLEDAKIGGSNFTGANFKGIKIRNATFNSDTRFPEGFNPADHDMWGPRLDYSRRNLKGRQFTYEDFTGANFSRANLSQIVFWGCNLTEADFQNANLTGAQLAWSNLTGAKLDGANLREALFNSSTLFPEGFDPAGKGMWGPRLDHSHKNLTKRNFTWCDFSHANLSKANLTEATLYGCEFVGANLERANLTKAWLAQANFTDANLAHATLKGARYNDQTRWPEGFNPTGKGLIKE